MEKKSIVSAIVQLLVALNEALMAFGITQFQNVTTDSIYTVVSTIAMVVAWGYGLYKNHNFTDAACQAQGYLDILKGKAEDNTVTEMIEEDEDE
ncbi:phage holin [Zhenpiania hominis]|uniref:phage holin n=1 Tax=Zhenpiania hominis TaxID=2763644 RepID=UPI0039F5E694